MRQKEEVKFSIYPSKSCSSARLSVTKPPMCCEPPVMFEKKNIWYEIKLK